MADYREPSEKYDRIGRDVLDQEPDLAYIRNSEAQILFLTSCHTKRKKGGFVFAECEKVPDKYRWAVGADFTITVFEPNVAYFNDQQLRILMYHELLHIGIEQTEISENYSICPHDVQEFRSVIKRHGLDWAAPHLDNR